MCVEHTRTTAGVTAAVLYCEYNICPPFETKPVQYLYYYYHCAYTLDTTYRRRVYTLPPTSIHICM